MSKKSSPLSISLSVCLSLLVVCAGGYCWENADKYFAASDGGSESYTVPAGNSFWLYGVIADDGQNFLYINDTLFFWNYGNHTLNPPIRFYEGSELRVEAGATSTITFYGYEGVTNYTEGNPAANVYHSVSSYWGPPSTSYTVPAGKYFLLYGIFSRSSSGPKHPTISIDGNRIFRHYSTYEGFFDHRFDPPWEFPSNSVIAAQGAAGVLTFYGYEGTIIGLNENPDEAEVDTPFSSILVHPVPFNTQTTIRYNVESAGQTTISIYDQGGRLVRRFVDEADRPGTYTTYWDGRDSVGRQVAAGSYYCIVETDITSSRKLVHIK